MGQTVIEKIIGAHTCDDAKTGRIVWIDLDVRTARDFGGPNVVKNFNREYGQDPVHDTENTFFTFDLCVPACSLKYADNQQICRDFARKKGFNVYDVNEGIGSHILMENGHAGSGKTVVGTDSHMNILGAVDCFGQGMGDVDITFAFRTGKAWFEVPETVKIVVEGKPDPSSGAKDLTLFLLKELGTKKAALKSVEFVGDAVFNLSLAGRITLCSMVTEMAGIVGFIPGASSKTAQQISAWKGGPWSPLLPDSDAQYAEVIHVDADGLRPQAAVPFHPHHVQPVDDLGDVEIDTGFIGSCTNGRFEDFAAAAEVLKGKRIKPGVSLKIVPSTRRVYAELLDKGIIAALFQSGAVIGNPGCGGCAEGHIGLTGEGEVQVSTGNRNFEGKQGKGRTYLASPEVVAASCLLGRLGTPEEL